MDVKINFMRCSNALVHLLFIGQIVWIAVPAQVAESSEAESITVIQCEDITVPGAADIEIRYDGIVLKMVGVSSENHPFQIAEVKPQKEVVGTVFDYNCEGNTISITEKWAFRAILITQVYEWNGKNLVQTATDISDPSADSLEAALKEALDGNLDNAKSQLEGVMYPSHYLGCGPAVDFLRKGSKKAISIQKSKGFKKAAISLGNVFELIAEAYNSQKSELETAEPIPDRWLKILGGLPGTLFIC
jgi:hypothetical protein